MGEHASANWAQANPVVPGLHAFVGDLPTFHGFGASLGTVFIVVPAPASVAMVLQ